MSLRAVGSPRGIKHNQRPSGAAHVVLVFAPAEYAEPSGLWFEGNVVTSRNALLRGWHVDVCVVAAWNAQLGVDELVIGEEREQQ